MFGFLLPVSLWLVGAGLTSLSAFAGEPPGPWEPHTAILTADCIVLGVIVSHEASVARDCGMGLSSPVTVKLRVERVLRDVENLFDVGDSVRIRLPVRDVPVSEKERTGTWTDLVPELFSTHSRIWAALRTSAKEDYEPSSAWWYLAMWPDSEEAEHQIRQHLDGCPLDQKTARQVAAGALNAPPDSIKIDIAGGHVSEGVFQPSKRVDDPSVSLYWRARSMTTGKTVFVACDDQTVVH